MRSCSPAAWESARPACASSPVRACPTSAWRSTPPSTRQPPGTGTSRQAHPPSPCSSCALARTSRSPTNRGRCCARSRALRISTDSAAGRPVPAWVAAPDVAVRRLVDDVARHQARGRSVMNKLYIYAGIAASCVVIAIGIAAIAIGFEGRSTVRDEVAHEKIDTGQEARDFAAGMRVHTLADTKGLTYAEMPRFLEENGKPTADEKAAAIDP